MMKGRIVRSSALVSVALGVLAFSGAAQAQATDGGSGEEGDGAFDEIVVTAQFREQNIQDTPLAISAVSGELAEARSQFSINDVARTSPSVNIEAGTGTGGSFPSVYIRGVGQSDPFPPLDPGVGVYIDDVYYGILTGANFDLLDLDRVEVLRGPQGTLAGKNSEGGAIKIFTNQPTNDLGGYVEATYGSYDRKQIRGAANIPIVDDKVMLRVSGMARSVNGFFKRLDFACANPTAVPKLPFSAGVSAVKGCVIGRAGGGDLTAFKGTLLIKPAEGVRNTMSFTSITDNQQVQPLKLLFQSTSWNRGLNFITGPREMTSYTTYVGNQYSATPYQGIDRSDVKQEIFSNTLDIDIGENLSLKSITAYIKTDSEGGYDNDLSPISVSLQDIIVKSEQFTQEIRLSGTSSLVDWTVGGFYFDNDILFPGRININRGFGANGQPGFVLDFLTNDPIKSRSKSGFAHAVVHVTDSFNVTGGIRYTDDFKRYTFVRLDPDGSPQSTLLGPINGLSNTFKGKRWDYRVAADYRFSPEFLVYAQFATGYKGGGVSPRPILPGQELPYDPESVKSFEAGFKADLLDRRLRLNATAFHQKFNDIQLQLGQCPHISGPGAPCALTANAGKAKIQGIEAELDFRPVEGLSINASGSLVDFKFTETDPNSGVLLTDKAPFISKYKFSIGAQYEIALSGGTLTPRLDLDYRSSFSVGAPANARQYNVTNGRTLMNARISYKPEGGDWELAVAATNLFDKFYYASKYDHASEAQGATAEGLVGRPREFSVSVKRNF
jgi:iron complex outermembrane receptor protein